jgi:hypothetical protein
MDAAALEHMRRLGEEGPRRFSNWDAPLFAAYGGTFLPAVFASLPPAQSGAFNGLMAMVQQGIGEGFLRGNPEDPPGNFLEYCIREWLPPTLAELPAEKQMALLASVWNLGEGLLREPDWVNGYVMSRIHELRRNNLPQEVLVEILRPLLEPAPAARWEAPYRVTLLSLRPADDEFLPGEMQLAAPTVLVVTDRRRPVRLGVHLQRMGKSIVLGAFGPTGSFPDEPAGVQVTWNGGTASIGVDTVSLPFLASPFRAAVVRAGYLVASSVDSQKLWIVESAA